MIKTEKVTIPINTRNITYYKNKGYRVNSGENVEIKISDLPLSSKLKIETICDICGKCNIIQYHCYIENIRRGDGIYICNHPCAKLKREQTFLKKYGNVNYTKSTDFINKNKKTLEEKYGVSNAFEIKGFLEKTKKTKKEKYGNENFNNRKKAKNTIINKYGQDFQKTKEYKDKCKKTSIKKFGYENCSLNPEIRNKQLQTNLKLYGDEYPMRTKIIQDKLKKTFNEKYGVNFPSQVPGANEQRKKTCLLKYGFEHPMQNQDIHIKQSKRGFSIKYYEGLYYRSSYELDFLIFCKKNFIVVEQGKTVSYVYKNKNKNYFYDFYLPKYNLIVEIKSTYTYNKYKLLNLAKKRACLKKDFNFIFIIDKNYEKLCSFININPDLDK